MFEKVIKTGIPIIGVTTDDLVNAEVMIRHWAGKMVAPWPISKQTVLKEDLVYVTGDYEQATPENYKRIHQADTRMVVLNPEKKSSLIFDAGELPTPDKFMEGYLGEIVPNSAIPAVMQALRGCSLKTASEICQLAGAFYHEITPKSIASMRMRLSGSTPGLFPLNTDYGYWEPQAEVNAWIAISKPYMGPGTPKELQPKGLMLHGLPGTGKSMAAKVIANSFGVPAFRLDIPTTLNRYIGESEARVARNLELLTQYAPCVVLLDEVEKVFGQDQDQGTTTRILSQLLWWLQERSVPCPVVMTTNHLGTIPPELYREGRLDGLVEVQPLGMESARHLAMKVLKTLVPQPTLKQTQQTKVLFGDPAGKYIPSHVHSRVVGLVKENKWA